MSSSDRQYPHMSYFSGLSYTVWLSSFTAMRIPRFQSLPQRLTNLSDQTARRLVDPFCVSFDRQMNECIYSTQSSPILNVYDGGASGISTDGPSSPMESTSTIREDSLRPRCFRTRRLHCTMAYMTNATDAKRVHGAGIMLTQLIPRKPTRGLPLKALVRLADKY